MGHQLNIKIRRDDMLEEVNIRILCKSVHTVIRHATVRANIITRLEVKIQMNVNENVNVWIFAIAMINVFLFYTLIYNFSSLSLFLPPIPDYAKLRAHETI